MSEHRKKQIIEMACIRMARLGYPSTTMRDLAADMGLEASSLYSYIQSKDEILIAICFGLAQELIEGINEVNDIYFNAEEKLRSAIKSHISIICSNPNAARVMQYEWRHLESSQKQEFIKLRDSYEKGFHEILKTGEQENLFKDEDRRFAVLTILSALNWVSEWYDTNGKLNSQEISNRLSDFILSGLKK